MEKSENAKIDPRSQGKSLKTIQSLGKSANSIIDFFGCLEKYAKVIISANLSIFAYIEPKHKFCDGCFLLQGIDYIVCLL